MKRVKQIITSPFLILKFLKKSNWDNFVGGLIFGAIFSLIVNVATIKVQETLTKQRTLEALEREMVHHLLTTNRVISSEKDVIANPVDSGGVVTNALSLRLSTRYWDTTAVSNYLFELDPESASTVEMYYEVLIRGYNKLLDDNEDLYKRLSEPCTPYYEQLTKIKPQTPEYCEMIAKESLSSHATIMSQVYNKQKEINEKFHPTRDRLNSWWLRMLLGDKTVNILR